MLTGLVGRAFHLGQRLHVLAGTGIPGAIAIDGRSIVPQLRCKPGIPRAWVHTALADRVGGETLFDGQFGLFRNSGELIDARVLPSPSLPPRTEQLLFPASGPATGSFNGLHAKSKFLPPSLARPGKDRAETGFQQPVS